MRCVSLGGRLLLSLAFGAVMAQEAAGPQNPEGPAAVDLPLAQVSGELASARVSDGGRQGDWPAATYTADGSLWVAWVEWNDTDADRVLVKRRDPQGSWGGPIELKDPNWDHYSPTLAAVPGGVMAVWAGQTDENYDLFATTVRNTGEVASVERLTTAPFSDFNVRAVSDKRGDVTIAWQSFRAGNSDIYARRYSGGSWGSEVLISSSLSDDWEPAIALNSEGTAWISWDSYETGNYDVFLRSFDGRKAGSLVTVTTEPTAQFHSSVTVDRQDRVWIAWDDGGQNWGKDFSRVSAAPGSRGLHYSRTLGVRVYNGSRIQDVSANIAASFTGRLQRYAELPTLATDSGGAVWMVFRHWTFPKPTEIYHFYAMELRGTQWSTPVRLLDSSGQNTQKASVASAPAGNLTVAYSGDGRSQTRQSTDPVHALHYNVYLAELPKGKGPSGASFSDARLPAPQIRGALRPRATTTDSGKTLYLLLGDAHRHTDIRGHSGVDGSVLDTYRYAMDPAQLDWLGTSDHNEVTGGRWPDGLRDYQWWTTQKTVDLMSHPPVFFGVYSYEHSLARPSGHRNILYLRRGGPLRVADREKKQEDNLPPNLWAWITENAFKQPGQRVIVVPHTFGEKSQPLADFKWESARFDCLLEIYQGARSSYESWKTPAGERRGSSQVEEEGHFANDAIANGSKYGFVSFSDHGSTHNSWAGVWSPSEDRSGLFEGMYARHTYAASDEIIVKATADGHLPGEEFTEPAGKSPLIKATVDAPDTILRIDVIKDGKYIYTTKPNGRKADLSFKDNASKAGKAYYYLRVFQRDTENPNGDPEIAWTSPWYVTYQ